MADDTKKQLTHAEKYILFMKEFHRTEEKAPPQPTDRRPAVPKGLGFTHGE